MPDGRWDLVAAIGAIVIVAAAAGLGGALLAHRIWRGRR